jgi:hypothetical protein
LWEKDRLRKLEQEKAEKERKKITNGLVIKTLDEQMLVSQDRKMQEQQQQIEEAIKLVSIGGIIV